MKVSDDAVSERRSGMMQAQAGATAGEVRAGGGALTAAQREAAIRHQRASASLLRSRSPSRARLATPESFLRPSNATNPAREGVAMGGRLVEGGSVITIRKVWWRDKDRRRDRKKSERVSKRKIEGFGNGEVNRTGAVQLC
jgi:hypothetical protein